MDLDELHDILILNIAVAWGALSFQWIFGHVDHLFWFHFFQSIIGNAIGSAIFIIGIYFWRKWKRKRMKRELSDWPRSFDIILKHDKSLCGVMSTKNLVDAQKEFNEFCEKCGLNSDEYFLEEKEGIKIDS